MKAPAETILRGADGSSDTTYGGDPLLAAQLGPWVGRESLTGEARLALAVVEDAVSTVRLTVGVHAPRARRLATEAWAWIASHDTSHPFAFENLCDHLGLDAAWLRRGLRSVGGAGGRSGRLA